jgi:hypothetical protein
MTSKTRLFRGIFALIVAAVAFVGTAVSQAASEPADSPQHIQVPANADEDTVKALNQLFAPEMTAPEVARLLGWPSQAVDKQDVDNYTAVYRGVLYRYDRSSNHPDLPIQIKNGDSQPGSLTVSFVYRDGRVAKITAQ